MLGRLSLTIFSFTLLVPLACSIQTPRQPERGAQDGVPTRAPIDLPPRKRTDPWRPSIDYNVLLPGIRPPDGRKVEILELSMYTTYAVYAEADKFRPVLKRWLKAHESTVTYRRQPSIAYGMEHAKLQARIFFALEDLGRDDLQEQLDVWVSDPARRRVYHTIWNPDEAAVYEMTRQFAKENGIDEKAFHNAYYSPANDMRIREMLGLSAWAKMDGSPTFVIDGRYSVSAQRLAYPRSKIESTDFERLLQLIDYLVESRISARASMERARVNSRK